MNPAVSSGGPRLHGRLMLGLALAYAGLVASSASAAGYQRDRTPLPSDLSGVPGKAATTTSGGVGSTSNEALHMLLGLLIVCALIFGLYKLLRRSAIKNGKLVRDDGWIQVVSSTPLAQSRSLHLVRVGEELVLIGSSEQSLTPIRVYGPEEAKRLGVDTSEQQAPVRIGQGANPSFGTALLESLKRMTAR
jgi:flagellar protein FliO/FliZ